MRWNFISKSMCTVCGLVSNIKTNCGCVYVCIAYKRDGWAAECVYVSTISLSHIISSSTDGLYTKLGCIEMVTKQFYISIWINSVLIETYNVNVWLFHPHISWWLTCLVVRHNRIFIYSQSGFIDALLMITFGNYDIRYIYNVHVNACQICASIVCRCWKSNSWYHV